MATDEKEALYQQAVNQMKEAKDASEFSLAAQRFLSLGDYKDSAKFQAKCTKKADECMKQKTYVNAVSVLNDKTADLEKLQTARTMLESLNGWGDSNAKAAEITKRISKLSTNGSKGSSNSRKIKVAVFIAVALVVLSAGTWTYFTFFRDGDDESSRSKTKKERRVDTAKIPFDPDDIIDNNSYDYREITDMLEEAGFTNVDVEAVDDLITGIIQHQGSVESISVEGKRNFKKGDEFDADVHITVRYHSR